MAGYEQEFIDLANELLAEFGTDGVYRINGAESDTSKPWLQVDGTGVEHPVRIAVFPTDWRNETSRRYADNTEVPAGKVEGIIAASGFEPVLPAVVIVGPDQYRIINVDKIAPAGIAIIYTLELEQ